MTNAGSSLVVCLGITSSIAEDKYLPRSPMVPEPFFTISMFCPFFVRNSSIFGTTKVSSGNLCYVPFEKPDQSVSTALCLTRTSGFLNKC